MRTVHLHLHDGRGAALTSAYAALGELDQRHTLIIDAAIGGMGGCPYCGNGRATKMIPTEDLVELLEGEGIETGVDLAALIEAAHLAERVVGHELYGHVSKAGPRPGPDSLYPMDMPLVETVEQAQHFRLGPQTYAGAPAPWKEPIHSAARDAVDAAPRPGSGPMTAPATPVTGSLHGLRVIELGTSVAAPMAGQILGDLGAEVVKVERVGRGDDSRSWAPPHWDGESVTFLALNRNKRSLALDYKDPRGKQVLKDLIRDADVLVHNLRPGAVAAAGFGEDELRRLNPRLINVELTGFGPNGPRAAQPGYDPLLQAYSGIVSITGQDSGPPSRVPVSLLDMGTGMWAVVAVYEALRRRDATGLGCHVELSLLQTALTWLSMPLLTVLAGNPAPERLGSGLAGVVPYGAYPTSDGYVFISAGNDTAWARLCQALDAASLRDREGFATNTERVLARGAVDSELGVVTRAFDTAEVLRRLGAAGVPCAPVQTLDRGRPGRAGRRHRRDQLAAARADHRAVGGEPARDL